MADGQPIMPDFDPDFAASFPNLWVFLTWRDVGDFQKLPGKLTIAADGTGWKATYYDPSARRGCSVFAPTLMDALRRLDCAVVAPDTAWSGGGGKRSGWTKKKP